MPLIAIPNISVTSGSDVNAFSSVVEAHGGRVLDVHSDREHGRTVLTCTASTPQLVDAMTALAREAFRVIDLTTHEGHHPRVGALDVCPYVPHGEPMEHAVAAAHQTAARLGAEGIPVFLYGDAADGRELPEIRAGGLAALRGRIEAGALPDAGPRQIDPRTGVVCVGARRVLIAFNVWIDGSIDIARRVASDVRSLSRDIRALGLDVSAHGTSQVSMNLVSPERTGIDDAFAMVENVAGKYGSQATATELVGLVPERFLPSPDATAARLLIEPGRSLEAALDA